VNSDAAQASAEGAEVLWHLLRDVERAVRDAVAARRAADPDPDDPYRGQYLTPEAVERILSAPAGQVAGTVPPELPANSRLGRLAADFGLTPLDVRVLLVALAPDVDTRFERLYGYLNDDLTRRRPTIALALELCGQHGAGRGRFRFSGTAPLMAGGLVEIVEAGRPLLSREVRVPDRVTAHLLGDDEPDARLRGLVTAVPAEGPDALGTERVGRLADAVRAGAGLVHLLDRDGDGALLARAGLAAAGRAALVVDLARLMAGAVPERPGAVLTTEARLSGAGIVLGPLDALDPGRPERTLLLRELCDAAEDLPVVVHGRRAWDPLWTRRGPVTVTVQAPGELERSERWERELASAAAQLSGGPGGLPALPGEPLAEAVAPYRLDGRQVASAADVAVRTAAVDGRPVNADDLRAAVRAQNGAGLARLARRIEPAVGWDDLVLPPTTHRQLRELALRARHRDQVLGRWRMRPGGGRGRGVIALFAGESGTGKTMSAEVVAADLGMELYVVDLSTVVDKYIGETEKNLERIFAEAGEVNAVLLFDEADAIFGKRSQVQDAHDRHANMESAYLLQRMESFDGIAVLTTNLRTNLDEAFTRRLDVIADFAVPDAPQRRALWDRCLGEEIPRSDDLDLGFCAERFELAGGSIRACAVTAAYLAAETGKPLSMHQVVSAVLQEYRKLGRLVLAGEFGPWLDHLPDELRA
jgi:ATPase family associated with various cellular activities (AAA)